MTDLMKRAFAIKHLAERCYELEKRLELNSSPIVIASLNNELESCKWAIEKLQEVKMEDNI